MQRYITTISDDPDRSRSFWPATGCVIAAITAVPNNAEDAVGEDVVAEAAYGAGLPCGTTAKAAASCIALIQTGVISFRRILPRIFVEAGWRTTWSTTMRTIDDRMCPRLRHT